MRAPAIKPDSASKASPRLRGELEGGGSFGLKDATTRDLFTMELAKDLRRDLTQMERKLWKILSAKKLGGYKFRRQQAVGEYIVDFVCMEKKLIVELDGGQHAEIRADHDLGRTYFLEKNGYTVLRFWNNEIFESLEGVADTILEALNSLPPLTPPASGRGKESSPHKWGKV